MSLRRVEVGDTAKFTWVSTGAVASSIYHEILTGSETMVSSVAGVSSGNGHYYAQAKVDSEGYYLSRWTAEVGGKPYVRSLPFKAVTMEVD